MTDKLATLDLNINDLPENLFIEGKKTLIEGFYKSKLAKGIDGLIIGKDVTFGHATPAVIAFRLATQNSDFAKFVGNFETGYAVACDKNGIPTEGAAKFYLSNVKNDYPTLSNKIMADEGKRYENLTNPSSELTQSNIPLSEAEKGIYKCLTQIICLMNGCGKLDEKLLTEASYVTKFSHDTNKIELTLRNINSYKDDAIKLFNGTNVKNIKSPVSSTSDFTIIIQNSNDGLKELNTMVGQFASTVYYNIIENYKKNLVTTFEGLGLSDPAGNSISHDVPLRWRR